MKVACIGQCSFGTEIVIAVLSPLPNVPLDGSKLTPAIPPLEVDHLSEAWELPARVRVSPHIHSFLRVQSLGAFKERGLATKKVGTTDVGVRRGKATNSLSRMLSVHVIRAIQMRATRGRLMRKR